MTTKEQWRELLLSIILIIGATVLTIFPFIYASKGQWLSAIIEAVSGLALWISLIQVKRLHTYYWPSRVGWSGVLLVLTVILYSGGIAGTGLLWWSLLPITSYILFESKGGTKALVLGLLIFGTAILLSNFSDLKVYFSITELIMATIVVLIISLLMYNFEKLVEQTIQDSKEKAKLLEEQIELKKSVDNQLFENLNKLEVEKEQQKSVRSAMLNLLEDAKQLESELKEEKTDVETKITERTNELNSEKIKLAASMASLPVGFVMVSISHDILFINNVALNILGLEKSKVKIFDDILHQFPKDSGIFKMHDDYHKEKITIGKSGEFSLESKILEVSLYPIIKKDGGANEVLGSILLLDDITEAKILDRSKDEFFSIASHELRTPLTAIRGNTSMILEYYADAIKDPELKAMVDDIHSSSIRLINIVNDFLNVSRLEQSRMVYDLKETDLNQLIPEIIKEYDVTSSRQKISIDYLPSKTPIPAVMADADKVRKYSLISLETPSSSLQRVELSSPPNLRINS